MSNEVMNTDIDKTPNIAKLEEKKRGKRKLRVGKVISTKMQKSISVMIEKTVKHPVYKKYYKKTSKFMAHDEKNECKVGDVVKIMETKPYSKNKRWRLVEILERAK